MSDIFDKVDSAENRKSWNLRCLKEQSSWLGQAKLKPGSNLSGSACVLVVSNRFARLSAQSNICIEGLIDSRFVYTSNVRDQITTALLCLSWGSHLVFDLLG